MKAKKIASSLALFLIISILTINNSCSERNETVSCFPNSVISVTINLSLPAYFELNNDGGWVYISEQQSGTRGLIVRRNGNSFVIYDRNAPHICPGAETTLEVKDGTYITCPKDGAIWFLIDGTPSKIANIPPKKYAYSFNGTILSIYN